MLGAIICALVRVPLQFLGVVRDVVNKLSGKDGGDWYEKLRLILREPVVAEVTLQTLTVSANLSLTERISRGNYGRVNECITESEFLHDPTSVGEWEWKLFDFEQDISFGEVDAAIRTDGWTPATIEQLLSFGEKYPNEQKKYFIFALNSFFMVGGFGIPPVLCYGAEGRILGLCHRVTFHAGSRFLAVRRKV